MSIRCLQWVRAENWLLGKNIPNWKNLMWKLWKKSEHFWFFLNSNAVLSNKTQSNLNEDITLYCFSTTDSPFHNKQATFPQCVCLRRPQVCEKNIYHRTWMVKTVHELCTTVCTPPERLRFIYHLERMFAEVTKDFFEFSIRGKRESSPH